MNLILMQNTVAVQSYLYARKLYEAQRLKEDASINLWGVALRHVETAPINAQEQYWMQCDAKLDQSTINAIVRCAIDDYYDKYKPDLSLQVDGFELKQPEFLAALQQGYLMSTIKMLKNT